MINNTELSAFLKAGWHLTEITTAQNGDQTIYQGKCADSSGNEAAAIWCIRRTTITTLNGVQTITEQFADGNMNYDKIWNNRTSLTYKYA